MKKIVFLLGLCVALNVVAGEVTWKQIQYTDSLKEGARILVGTTANDYVLGIYDHSVSKSNIHGVAATYGDDRHSVTADDANAYTVHKDGDKFYFVGSDGKYLYMYNTNKNLSSSETLNNQAKWTVSVDDRTGVATMKSVYSSSWQIYYNKTAASPLFCTYTSSPKTDANIADVCLYSDKAADWVEYVLQPEMTLMMGEDTLTTLLDWGKVVYDDSWGTEVNPYEEAHTIEVKAKDLSQSVDIQLSKGVYFTTSKDTVSRKGGSFMVQFSTDSKGVYTDTLYISCGDIKYKVTLRAEAADAKEVKPTLTLSTTELTLNPNLDNNMNDLQMFTFSVSNLEKNLYIKWEKGTIPSYSGDEAVVLAGDEYVDFGSATNMGTNDRVDEEVYVDVTCYTPGTYVSTLCFYTPDAQDKSKNAFEQRVTLTIVVRTDYTPTGTETIVEDHKLQTVKIMRHGRIMIRRANRIYNVIGQEITCD